jgi:hypothetical protein
MRMLFAEDKKKKEIKYRNNTNKNNKSLEDLHETHADKLLWTPNKLGVETVKKPHSNNNFIE